MTASETQVVKFDITEAAITELSEKYAEPKVPQNKDEYEVLKAGIKEVRDIRVAIDKERKAQNEAALAHQRAVNEMGNGIIERLKAIESPMKLCKQEVDEAEERRVREQEEKEAKRLEGIRARLDRIEEYGQVSINDTLEAVQKRLARVEELDPNDRFDEFAKTASNAKNVAHANLSAAIKLIEERERAEKEQEARQVELDKQADEQAAEGSRLAQEAIALAEQLSVKKAAERETELKRLKSLEDAEAVRKAKEKVEAEEAHQKAMAPDKEKLRVLAQSLREIETPVMTSDEGMMAIDRVIEQITVLVSDIESEADRL